MVRALASHQCGPGSNPGVDAICGLSLLLVLSLALRGFSPGTPVFPSPQKPTLSNSNSIWNARTRLTSSYEPNSNYNLRQADFSIPRYETVTYGKHSIRYLGPRLWTKLPKSIRDVTTLMSFKSKIRQLNISELLDDGCAGCSLCSF